MFSFVLCVFNASCATRCVIRISCFQRVSCYLVKGLLRGVTFLFFSLVFFVSFRKYLCVMKAFSICVMKALVCV